MHRNFALEHFYLDAELNLKIGNFRCAKKLQSTKEFTYTVCENYQFLSPQMLCQEGYTMNDSDTWSLGVLIYALLIGKLPFFDDNKAMHKQKILNCQPDLPK